MRVSSRCRSARDPSAKCAGITTLRRAFTLAEVAVACVVFAVGVLGLQAAAVVVLRQSQDARTQVIVQEVAAARFESFLHATCGESAAGDDTARGVSSAWHTSPLVNAPATLSSQTLRFGRGYRRHTDTYLGAFRCR